MHHDIELTAEVIAELRHVTASCHRSIDVRADKGVVTLRGYVATFAEKQATESAARRVAGVGRLSSEIAIRRHGNVPFPHVR